MAQADAYRQGKQICIQDVSLLDRGEFTVSSINLLVARWLGRSPQEMGPHGGPALASPVGWSGTTQVMVDEHSFCCHSLHCCHLGHFARGPTEQVWGVWRESWLMFAERVICVPGYWEPPRMLMPATGHPPGTEMSSRFVPIQRRLPTYPHPSISCHQSLYLVLSPWPSS